MNRFQIKKLLNETTALRKAFLAPFNPKRKSVKNQIIDSLEKDTKSFKDFKNSLTAEYRPDKRKKKEKIKEGLNSVAKSIKHKFETGNPILRANEKIRQKVLNKIAKKAEELKKPSKDSPITRWIDKHTKDSQSYFKAKKEKEKAAMRKEIYKKSKYKFK